MNHWSVEESGPVAYTISRRAPGQDPRCARIVATTTTTAGTDCSQHPVTVLAAHEVLTQIHPDEITVISTDSEWLSTRQVLENLDVLDPANPGPDIDAWDSTAADRFADEDSYLDDDQPVRWVRLNGRRLRPADVDDGTTVLVLQAEDGQPEATQPVIAYSSFMDSTGAPISWDDAASLGWVGETTILDRQWGDSENSAVILRVGSNRELTTLIANWISTSAGVLPFALATRPLPGLSEEEVDAVHEIGGNLEGESVDHHLDDALLDAVHLSLGADPSYLLLSGALADPGSDLGSLLYGLLRQVADESSTTNYWDVRQAFGDWPTDPDPAAVIHRPNGDGLAEDAQADPPTA